MSWDFRFSEPIVLADGVKLETLGESVAYLAEADRLVALDEN